MEEKSNDQIKNEVDAIDIEPYYKNIETEVSTYN